MDNGVDQAYRGRTPGRLRVARDGPVGMGISVLGGPQPALC